MIIKVTETDCNAFRMFSSLTDSALRKRIEGENGIFIAESPKVIVAALQSGFDPVALMMEEKHVMGDASDILNSISPEVPVYIGSRNILSSITGYELTRGVLCAFRRKKLLSTEELLDGTSRVIVIDKVSDATNIGSIFRSAAALGIDAILITPSTCDPLNRRSIRVSMGTVFRVPWTRISTDIASLKKLGFKTAAMALEKNSVNIDDTSLNKEKKIALIFGEEGYGLEKKVIEEADYVVCIPMQKNVDSLNVAASAAIACWQLGKSRK